MLMYIIIGIVVFLIIYAISLYNGLVRINNKVQEAFSTMDVYLKKRWDLIPNLVETVKGYAKHEEGTLENIVKLRSGAYDGMTDEEKIKTNQALSGQIGKLMVLVENYPDLKASDNFRDLTSQLSKIEDDIANSRKYYNGVVKLYNDKIQIFPNNIFAGMFGYTEKTMFETSSTERKNVQVKF